MTTCEELVFYWDSGASQWWLRPGTVANAKNVKSKTRQVEGAYGQLSTIKEKGSIKTYKGDIEVFTIENNTVNLASVSKNLQRFGYKNDVHFHRSMGNDSRRCKSSLHVR
jgi:hypothetical protein